MSASPLVSAFRSSLSEAWANGAGLLLPLGFFAGTAILVPFTLGPEADLLSRVGPGILWLALALSSMVTLERVFQADLQDGALDLWLLDSGSISMVAAIKTLTHWLVSGFPLVLLTPLLGYGLGVPAAKMGPAMLGYAMGGLVFFLWGGVAAALSASVARAGLLIALLALPLYVPALIFGVQMVEAGFDSPSFLFLCATMLFALGVAPAAMGAALRLAAE
ncbi:MAG: heme exporter protein CcmB [Pseudomonadota bacterium]